MEAARTLARILLHSLVLPRLPPKFLPPARMSRPCVKMAPDFNALGRGPT